VEPGLKAQAWVLQANGSVLVESLAKVQASPMGPGHSCNPFCGVAPLPPVYLLPGSGAWTLAEGRKVAS
jgi:hypothetical protein